MSIFHKSLHYEPRGLIFAAQ